MRFQVRKCASVAALAPVEDGLIIGATVHVLGVGCWVLG